MKNSKGNLFVVSAPSGAGKTSLVKSLLEARSDVGVAISHTTRPSRANETDGVNYHFVSEDHFKELISEQAFIEFAEVFGNYYGTSKAEIEKQLSEGKHIILEIDWQGAKQIRERLSECVCIFILPPSLTALEERLQGRGMDDPSTIERRTREAINEISHYDEFDYVVVNEHFSEARDELVRIVTNQPDELRLDSQSERLKPLLTDLLRNR